MTDKHLYLKIIELPDGSKLVPFTDWIFKIRNSHLTFKKWHLAQYKNKGRQFPIYDCDWESPTSSTELISPAECDAMWQTVFEYFIRSRQEATVFEEMLQIANEEGDVYLSLNDILEFSQASKIGLELLDEVNKFPETDREKNKTKSQSAVTNGNNTILEILGGVIIDAYNYDIHAKRYDFIVELKQNLERVGVSKREDTLRKWIRAASELIEKKEDSTKR